MRSVIVFALLALAVCQSPIDAINSLSNQLNINNADALSCVSGLYAEVETVLPLYKDLLSQDFESLIMNGAIFIQGFEPAVQAACTPLVQDLITYAVTYGNGVDAKTNLEINSVYVLRQLALLAEYVTEKNFTAIGSTVGYIFQIAVGATDLPSLDSPSWTAYQYFVYKQNIAMLQINQNGAMEVFLQSYVNELGLGEQVNASSLVQLIKDIRIFVFNAQTFESTIKSGNFDGDITATEAFVNTALELLRANKQGLESIVALDAPVVVALYNNPVAFIGSVVFNVLLNAPQIKGFHQQYLFSFFAGDFAAAGVEYANFVKDVFGAVYSH